MKTFKIIFKIPPGGGGGGGGGGSLPLEAVPDTREKKKTAGKGYPNQVWARTRGSRKGCQNRQKK